MKCGTGKMSQTIRKPLGRKAYGSIGHLPGSRLGSGDHSVSPGQARICMERRRDEHDRIIVQEKLDGSCTAVARIGDEIVPLGRAGWPAWTHPHENIRLFGVWAMQQEARFRSLLKDGERLVGEWLAQAVGTRYALLGYHSKPWMAFDLMREGRRAVWDEFVSRVEGIFQVPPTWYRDDGGPIAVDDAYRHFSRLNSYRAMDPIEGVVYRCERRGKVEFLAKWVRHDKVDGCYFPEVSGQDAVWNWSPK